MILLLLLLLLMLMLYLLMVRMGSAVGGERAAFTVAATMMMCFKS